MGEHLLDVQGVRGSSPLVSTIFINAPVAQRIAHLIPIQKVTGSIPVGRAISYGAVAQLGEHYAGSVEVEGSSPFSSTNTKNNRD